MERKIKNLHKVRAECREALRKHVEQEDVTKRDTPTAGGTQQMQYVNESGLYALILSSKLESAYRSVAKGLPSRCGEYTDYWCRVKRK